MHNKHLETFLTVADCRSLTKASKLLYLSPTAIMKQINQFEEHMGVKLFTRTNRGLTLTEAGRSVYSDGQFLVHYSKEAANRARQVMGAGLHPIRVGTSPMNPARHISGLLQSIVREDPAFQFSIVPFSDLREDYAQIVSHLGEEMDVIAGVYGFSDWTSHLHNTLKLSDEPICLAVSAGHRLAGRESVQPGDLHGETLFITQPGDSAQLDAVRADLEENHPEIHLLIAKTFDLMIYNQCAVSNNILLTTPMWAELHPMLKALPVEWDYTVPYGILYSLDPDAAVERFIDRIQALRA